MKKVDIKVYSTDVCPYCVRAKNLLQKEELSFEEINISKNPEKREEMLSLSGGRTSVPQIFIGSHHVGGSDDLFLLVKEGKLEALLQG